MSLVPSTRAPDPSRPRTARADTANLEEDSKPLPSSTRKERPMTPRDEAVLALWIKNLAHPPRIKPRERTMAIPLLRAHLSDVA